MNFFQLIILISLVGNTAIGLFVLFSNPKRAVNIAFFSLVLFMTLWLGSMFLVTLSKTEPVIRRFVCQTSAFAGLIPLGVIILQAAIINPNITILQILYKLRYWLLAGLSVVVLCYSPVFVLSSNPLETKLIPSTVYGWGFPVLIVYFIGAILLMTIEFWKATKAKSGVQKTEIQFLQMGCIFSFIIGISLAAFAEVFNNKEISLFVPLSALALDGFVTYGIATRRILDVPAVLQRVVAYVLMACYLIILYVLVEWLGRVLLFRLIPNTTDLSHLLAALVVAFSVAPAHGWMQAVSHRLFASANLLDVNVVLEQAAQMFQEVAAETTLVTNFSNLVSKSFGTAEVVLLQSEGDGSYIQTHSAQAGGNPLRFPSGSAVAELLTHDREPFTVDTLQRMRPGPLVAGALKELEEAGAVLAVGSFVRKEMKAILLLSPKKSGRIYDLRDQRALQLLGDQLAVALENSNLYTAVQNAKIYNEILLDSLTSGIIAVNSNRIVTVFNQRAQKLTRLAESAVIDQPISILPPALADGLETILNTHAGFHDRDMTILLDGEEIPVRVSGSVFRSHTGSLLGALLVFNDMTVLKKMEEQIRRTDRLSSIGTLSAGMAHEIKNPLVTIKTFTQLLPQQYTDADFRRTFFDLVDQEVKRIDTIVNRLLNFARPAKAVLKPVSLHEIIENSLRLVEQQLHQHEIRLERHLNAKRHIIEADAEQLNQIFINFFLNAVHAMGKGGTLTVRTSVVRLPPANGEQAGDCIQVDVQDTGCGIAPEELSKIFDPFFTTKEDGVGLGLSVAHGIIQEHNGNIDVESEKGKGSVFHVQFPLLKPQEKPEK